MKFLIIIAILNFIISTYSLADDKVVDKNKEVEKYILNNDTYEVFNRSVFKFNMFFNNNIGIPVTKIYSNYTPKPIKIGLNNFFDNLKTPLSALNFLLQGKIKESLERTMKFIMNSTFGFGGILDVSSTMKLKNTNEDFGQTLAKWGLWKKSNYLVIPFLGSYTTRSFIGGFADYFSNPLYNIPIIKDKDNIRFKYNTLSKSIDYTKIVPFLDELKNQPEPYVFVRESYLQFRRNQLYDGNIPKQELDDFDIE